MKSPVAEWVLLGSLLAILLRHLRLVVEPAPEWVARLGWLEDGAAAGLLLAAAWCAVRRRGRDRVALALVAVVAATGLWVAAAVHPDLVEVKRAVRGGLLLDPGPWPSLPWLVYGHVALAGALLCAVLLDRGRMGLGATLGAGALAVAVAIAASANSARATPVRAPSGSAEPCVEPAGRMRTDHARLLATWRDQAVRGGNRTFLGSDGRRHPASLSGTCLRCHDAGGFCRSCHQSLGVGADCFGCHTPSEGR